MRLRLLSFLVALLAASAAPALEKVHPPFWTVHGPKGTAYLLGSFHLLPPDTDWRTRDIDRALHRADVLVFEIKMDDAFQETMRRALSEQGTLPEGEHLRDKLSPAARAAFDKELADLAQPEALYDRMRPWRASITLDIAVMHKLGFDENSGIELTISPPGHPDPRPTLGLESPETQLALLIPKDPKDEVRTFEQDLAENAQIASGNLGQMFDAWKKGDAKTIARLVDESFSPYPDLRKAVFDDRNAAWVDEIADLLKQKKVYFITVGAGHLAGPRGVPSLLRAKGYRVQGP